jgi:hydrogenase expression/formation protein HypC
MCIGNPMRVIESWNDGALVEGRGRLERVDTRLVADGACVPGQWLLVFQGAARELIEPERAAEVNAALDLLEAAMAGDVEGAAADPGFVLPSSMTTAQLQQLTQASPAVAVAVAAGDRKVSP